jgi:hypothetical protein
LLKEDSALISIEQLGVWIETGQWLAHGPAAYVGVKEDALSAILNKHAEEALKISGLVDGERRDLRPSEQRDYVFHMIWARIAGLYLAGGQGNVRVEGRSISAYLPSKLRQPVSTDTILMSLKSGTTIDPSARGTCRLAHLRPALPRTANSRRAQQRAALKGLDAAANAGQWSRSTLSLLRSGTRHHSS